VGDPKNPGLQGAPTIEGLEAPPDLKMNVLPQVVTFFRVGLISGGQPIESAAELPNRGLVQFIPLRRGRAAADIAPHKINSRCIREFITLPALPAVRR
jgi:hypothetical protein